MIAVEQHEPLLPAKRYLCITHSDRPASLDKCDLNYLETRFSRPDRLPPKEPFTSLLPSKAHSPFGGNITVHEIGHGYETRLIALLRPDTYKPQHAVWHKGLLWVLSVEHIEVYDDTLQSVATIQDPWLAGGHTIAPDGRGSMLVSCSASDSVLQIDCDSFSPTKALRVPEVLYGRNYELRRTDSVIDHYITNDLQLAHVNAATAWREGILVSSLIPGAIGWFAPDGQYREILRGYVGIHGVRVAQNGEIYFCDSCNGILVSAQAQQSGLVITSRVKTNSLWLHDAVQIGEDIFALAEFENNVVNFINIRTRNIVANTDCSTYGGPQFLAY